MRYAPPSIGLFWLLATLCAVATSCKPHIVEYRTKPSYYDQMSNSGFQDGMTKDGVEIRWVDSNAPRPDALEENIGGERFRIREEREDGTVVLRAKLPRHVLVNTLACLRNNEYQLLWDDLLATSTQSFYADQDKGYEKYETHLRKHRRDMASLLNRMVVGQTFNEIIINYANDGTITCRLRKKLMPRFKFKEVLMVQEGSDLKLLTIR